MYEMNWIRNLSKFVITRRFSSGKFFPNDKLLPLIKIGKPSQATIYIKGFLTRNEAPDDFIVWRESHLKLCQNTINSWEPYALGYRWQNQSYRSHFDHINGFLFGYNKNQELGFRLPINLPVPVMTLSASSANILFKLFKGTRLFTPWGLALAAGQDIALIATQFIFQYQKAKENSFQHGLTLNHHINLLRRNNKYIRVVSHSMGCRLILNALLHQDKNQVLIDELHLLAPAITQSEFIEFMKKYKGTFPVRKVFIYYSQSDFILDIFQYLENDSAIGYHGLLNEYQGIKTYDVTQDLQGFNKHKSYSNLFPNFVKH